MVNKNELRDTSLILHVFICSITKENERVSVEKCVYCTCMCWHGNTTDPLRQVQLYARAIHQPCCVLPSTQVMDVVRSSTLPTGRTAICFYTNMYDHATMRLGQSKRGLRSDLVGSLCSSLLGLVAWDLHAECRLTICVASYPPSDYYHGRVHWLVCHQPESKKCSRMWNVPATLPVFEVTIGLEEAKRVWSIRDFRRTAEVSGTISAPFPKRARVACSSNS